MVINYKNITYYKRSLLILFLIIIVLLLITPSQSLARPSLKIGNTGTDVKNLNDRLYQLNYLPVHLGRVYTEDTRDAVIAFQKWKKINPDGVAGPTTRKKLKYAHVPSPIIKRKGKYIVIYKPKQLLFEMKDGKVLWTIHISSAQAPYYTPTGVFSVFRKEVRSWSNPYKVWLPYASYFTGGIAMHGYPVVPTYPASHGCVRVPMNFAPRVYKFASYGTTVIVK